MNRGVPVSYSFLLNSLRLLLTTIVTTPPEYLDKFKSDPKAYLEFRRRIENVLNKPMEALYLNTDAEKRAFEACREHMRTKLAKKPEIFDALVPDFAVGCRRLTPGPGVYNLDCQSVIVC